jgi:hypothetical protein
MSVPPPSAITPKARSGDLADRPYAAKMTIRGRVVVLAKAFAVKVTGKTTIKHAAASAGAVRVTGSVGPAAPDRNAVVTLLARRASSKGKFHIVGGQTLTKGHSRFSIHGRLRSGTWTIKVRYGDPGLLTAGTGPGRKLTVRG